MTLTLLVEERFAAAAARSAEILVEETPRRRAAVEIVTGDIARPGLGLPEKAAGRLREDCDHIAHLAALYDLAVGRDAAERVNVTGTAHVNDFARSLPRLERYLYVSTAYVAGRRRGLVLESELEHEAGFHNHYEETKHRAERLVRAMQREGLPAVIARPSIVVGRSSDGWTGKYDGPYFMLRLLDRLPRFLRGLAVGRRDAPFNVVPVDFVVAALDLLLEHPEAPGGTFHLADPEPLSSAELFASLSEALRGRPPSWPVPTPLVRLGAALGAFRLFGIPGESVPYLSLRQRLDCSRASALLEGSGIACPPLGSYLELLVRYYREHPVPESMDRRRETSAPPR